MISLDPKVGNTMVRSPRTLILVTLAALATLGAVGLLAQSVWQIGNLNDPVGLPVPNIVHGEQTFAYLVHPAEQCNCTEGFVQLENTLFWLHFDPWMIPRNFEVRPGLRPAIWNPSIDRWVPGGYFYEGPSIVVDVADAGPFLLQVPSFNAPWMNIYEFYFLTLTFESPLEANLLGDGMDQPGIAYVSPNGNFWIDLYGPDKTSGGKPIIWGDVLCGADDGSPSPVPQAAPRLDPPYPNPFNPSTSLQLEMDQPGHVTLTVHDARGNLVAVLADENRGRGTWRFQWDGTDSHGRLSPAGLYFFRAETADGVTVHKAALVK